MSLQFKALGKERRIAARNVASGVLRNGYRPTATTLPRELRRRLLDTGKFDSIIGSILISIAVKLALELIKYWIEQKLKSIPNGDFQSGEPGFAV